MADHPRVAAFTDTYLPTVNGATYTVRTWRERWQARGGRMDVVYPDADYDPDPGEHPVASVDFPFYEGYRLAAPHTPRGVVTPDVVHAHSPFAVGVAGYRYARRHDAPLVVSYHTPTSEYVEYVAPDALTPSLERVSAAWERWFLDRADLVLAPSERACDRVRDLGVSTPADSLPNGVDVDFFAPTDASDFRERYGLSGTLVGYTGRHGYEKRLSDLVDAAADLDATLVLGGDGPARDDLEARARRRGIDARFLGFLPREELPAFYSALDVFAFPSPVETQGLVALEANACGTPVVGADAGALIETVDDGETGYHYPVGDAAAFRDAIRRALDERDALAETCLDRREEVSVSRAVDRLAAVYDRLLG
ncbi:glycosyltransferase [Halarchaeum nitratireducens]|uniref:Glycosyl transferase family 1 n=1 Tax=Halarchaeum nitratireducens TaxID=489913 RepID=A0A830GCL4_9EURY|nr:glycosyltransferase [Halarchaeum nitratireducens]GGN18832.1 glycosyl transferase family 1 [Halarchaeum nitratireducens]